MSFRNLKKNDIVFCESNSRVLKLVEKQNNVWNTQDLFSKQPIKLSSNQPFKLVEIHRKVLKPMSMLKLMEQDEGVPSTLTEKEVFIVDYLLSEVDQSLLHQAQRVFSKMESLRDMTTVTNNIFLPIIKYMSLDKSSNDVRLLQYVFCALENLDGSEINTSTRIERLSSFRYERVEIRKQIEYVNWIVHNIPSFNEEDLRDEIENINDNFWGWSPDSDYSDYGDSDTLGWDDENLSLDNGPLVIR
jgi:hypothetical protein